MLQQIRKLLKAVEAQHRVVLRLEATGESPLLEMERRLEVDLRRRLNEARAVYIDDVEASLTPAPLPLIIAPVD